MNYGELLGGKLFDLDMPLVAGTSTTVTQAGAGSRSLSASTRWSAPSPQRVDIPAKVNGSYTYVHDIRVPECSTPRCRPRGGGATSVNHRRRAST